MEWALAANQIMQGGYSAYLMGERNKIAQADLSLRQRSFAADLERQKADIALRDREMNMRESLNKIAVRQANDAYDLNSAMAESHPEIDRQFGQLERMTIDEDVEGLRKAKFTPITLPATWSKATQDRMNAQLGAQFRQSQMAALNASSSFQTKKTTVDNLIDYNTKLAQDSAKDKNAALKRHMADETRVLIQAGMPVSQLPADMAALVAEADQYAAERKLASSEKYQTAGLLASARGAVALATANKDRYAFYDDRLKSRDAEITQMEKNVAGVDLPVGPKKELLPKQMRQIDWLKRMRNVEARNAAAARAGKRTPEQMAQLYSEDEGFIEVEYEFETAAKRDPVTGKEIPPQKVKSKRDLSKAELPGLMAFLEQNNGKINSQVLILRPDYSSEEESAKASTGKAKAGGKTPPKEKAGEKAPPAKSVNL